VGSIILQILFWGSVLMVLWAYVGYFATMWILSVVRPKTVNRKDWFPQISLIITARNEEKRIAQKLENSLTLEYPKDKLEIIVASDASTDATETIIKSFADRGVKLLTVPVHKGKHFAQHQGVLAAISDIVVFTDATTFLERDALSKIVRSYADSRIGCVSGEDRTETAGGEPAGEASYVRYEMKLRGFESRVGSSVGASGCFFSTRKSLCNNWVDDLSSDFYLPIIAKMRGFRAVIDPDAIASYRVVNDPSHEFERKVRTVVHGIDALFHFKGIMNPFKHGGYSFQIMSHKLCRWLVPFGLITAFAANIPLMYQGWFYQFTLAAQMLLYLLALACYFIRGLQRFSPFKFPFFFSMVNLSILVAWYKYLSGDKYVAWVSTKR